jgi:hypothetical protein
MLRGAEPPHLIQIKTTDGARCSLPVDAGSLNRPGSKGDGMRKTCKTLTAAIMLSGSISAFIEPARAFDFTGAWATNADQCNKVFVKDKSGQVTFAPDSEVFGGGFIAEPNRLVGRFAKCTIKSKKDDGEIMNMIASCASDIMLSSVQFELKMVDQNKILRLFPGMEDMQIGYYRCQI